MTPQARKAATHRSQLGAPPDCRVAIQLIEHLRYTWILRVVRLIGATAVVTVAQTSLHAAESWTEALSKMPLRSAVAELNRTNCVELMLHALESNHTVKGLIFMPGATDEFYLFRRAKAELRTTSPTLLDAVSALTNQTNIRVSFRPPLLLLHTDEDPLEPDEVVLDQKTADSLRTDTFIPHLLCNDRDWDYLQPLLKRWLKLELRPWRYSTVSWHFYRHSFAAWDLNGLEALEAAAFAGKSKFVIYRKKVIFEVDRRVCAKPSFDIHLH